MSKYRFQIEFADGTTHQVLAVGKKQAREFAVQAALDAGYSVHDDGATVLVVEWLDNAPDTPTNAGIPIPGGFDY